MANWCRTSGAFIGPEEELLALQQLMADVREEYGYLRKRPDEPYEAYQSDILNGLISRYPEKATEPIAYSGAICISDNAVDGKLGFFMETKWVAMTDILILMRDIVAPGCRIRYTAEEPMMGYFESNEPSHAGKYILYSWEDIEGLPPITFDKPISKEDLFKWLESAFGIGTFRELLSKLSEYPIQVGYYEPAPEL